jgi:hypothetical protein
MINAMVMPAKPEGPVAGHLAAAAAAALLLVSLFPCMPRQCSFCCTLQEFVLLC